MKVYYRSSRFDHATMICPDGGIPYASDMEWEVRPIESLANDDVQFPIVDNRITPEEQVEVERVIREAPHRRFVITVVDPGRYHMKDPYYHFLYRVAALPNTIILSKYPPVDITEDLRGLVGPARFIVSPHPYLESRETKMAPALRRNRVIFAGDVNPGLYPNRASLYRSRRGNPLLRAMVVRLEHPGYRDVGDKVVHKVIGQAFIDFLASYRYMFMCPSKYQVDFLKYRECAYAGCIPVGTPPSTFSDELKACVLPFNLERPTLSALGYLAASRGGDGARVARFARLQREAFSSATLNRNLDAALVRAPLQTP